MKNSELLKMENDKFLSSIDRQRRYVLRRFATPTGCPNCNMRLNYFQAAGIEIDDLDLVRGDNHPTFKCPACKRALRRILPMMGDEHWALVPITPAPEPEET